MSKMSFFWIFMAKEERVFGEGDNLIFEELDVLKQEPI